MNAINEIKAKDIKQLENFSRDIVKNKDTNNIGLNWLLKNISKQLDLESRVLIK